MKRFRLSAGRAVVAVVALAVIAFVAAANVGASPAAPVASIKQMLASIARDAHATRLAVSDKSTGLREIKREVKLIQAASNRLEVSAQVDEGYCGTGGVQCGGGGHTFAPASSANHNPVRIVLLVTLDGAPVTGLTAASFDFSDGLVPAGGSAPVLCPGGGSGCGPDSAPSDAGNGMYVFFAHPGPAGDWKAGAYFARFTATDSAGNKGSVLIEIDIP
jgi:hypothetical protein